MLKEKLGVSKSRPWRGRRSKRICTPQEFRDIVVDGGLIRVNNSGRGIPQGSPISAVLSNMYMLDVDRTMAKAVNKVSGYYRRYCDDILIVVRDDEAEHAVSTLKSAIADSKLKLQGDKSTISVFSRESSNQVVDSYPLQYLGFTFDGSRIHIRSSSVQRYLTRMKGSIYSRRRDRRLANERARLSGGLPRPLFSRKLRQRYSPVGRRNFVRYAHRAADNMRSSDLKKQIRRLVRQFERELREAKNSVR